jgi:hypothetical protein
MAIYKGNYVSDFDRITYLTSLKVALIDTSGNSPITNNTTYEFDLDYLPLIYAQNTARITRNDKFCQPNLTKRYAKLFLSATQYLKVDLPTSGNKSEFNLFFEQVAANPRIISIGLEGEKVNDRFVRLA